MIDPRLSKQDTWYDWMRLVAAWRCLPGKYALSVPALATLCKRYPDVILKEVISCGWAQVNHCDDVEGPVVRLNLTRPCTCEMTSWAVGTPSYYAHLTKHQWQEELGSLISTPKSIEEANAFLDKYPWPAYKGYKEGAGIEGKTGLIEYLTIGQIIKMKRIARGEIPFQEMLGEEVKKK